MPSSEKPPQPADTPWSQDVERSWARIEAWTREHLPELAATFQPPATEAAIQKAEKKLGVAFPEDVRASYLRHDGQTYQGPAMIFFEDVFQLLPLEDMIGEAVDWRALKKEMEEEIEAFNADDGIRPVAFHRKWVPIGKAGGSDLIVADLAPDEGGHSGQLVEVTHDSADRRLVGPSLGAWLSRMADDLEAGLYRFGRYHLERRGGVPIFRGPPPAEVELPPFEERFPEIAKKLATAKRTSDETMEDDLKKALKAPQNIEWFDVYGREILPEVGALRNLTQLTVRRAGRRIPPELGYLTKLEALTFESECGQIGVFPRALRTMGSESASGLAIELSWNRVGTFPAVFLEMPQITELQLRKCGLLQLPAGIGHLKRLKTLLLDSNDIAVLPDELAECTSLEHLALGVAWFDVQRDTVLGKLGSLVQLELTKGELSELPASLAGLPRLRVLNLQENHVRRLNGLTFAGLEEIRLFANRVAFAADVAPFLDANPTIKLVELGSNPISLLPQEGEVLKAAYPNVKFELGNTCIISELDPVADRAALERIAQEAKKAYDVEEAKRLLAKQAFGR